MKAAVVFVLAAAAACGGSSKQQTLGNQNAMAAKRDDLSLLPIDSEIVLGVNVAQLQASSLWQRLLAPRFLGGEVGRGMAELKRLCNIDPLAEATTVSAGVKSITSSTPNMVFVVRGLARSKVTACLANPTVVADLHNEGLEVKRDGEALVLQEPRSPTALALEFLDDTTLVAMAGTRASRAGLDALVASQTSLRSSPAFAALYDKIDTHASVWGLANGNSDLLGMLAGELGTRPKALFGSLNVTDRIDVDLRMRLDVPDAASQFAAGLQQQATVVKAFVDRIDVTSEGTDVRLALSLSEQKLSALTQMKGF